MLDSLLILAAEAKKRDDTDHRESEGQWVSNRLVYLVGSSHRDYPLGHKNVLRRSETRHCAIAKNSTRQSIPLIYRLLVHLVQIAATERQGMLNKGSCHPRRAVYLDQEKILPSRYTYL